MNEENVCDSRSRNPHFFFRSRRSFLSAFHFPDRDDDIVDDLVFPRRKKITGDETILIKWTSKNLSVLTIPSMMADRPLIKLLAGQLFIILITKNYQPNDQFLLIQDGWLTSIDANIVYAAVLPMYRCSRCIDLKKYKCLRKLCM